MVFLLSIIAQWFSRGTLLQIFFQQEATLFLVSIFLGAVVLSSPIQGYMSDLTSRKKVILLSLSAVIVSLLLILIGPKVFSVKFPVILGIAAVVNGVFGNVFPASGAALADRTGKQAKSLSHSVLCRYLGLGSGVLLPVAQTSKLFFGVALAAIALLWVVWDVEDGKIALEKR